MNIGFIGNFIPPYSTENDRKWSFEKLGHKVIPFQENITTAKILIDAMPELDMLVYSHTHDPSYVIDGLIDVFRGYKEAGIPTVSVHLDRWAWLARVEDVGKEATWFTEHIFMADASPEAVDLYDKFNLNWHYLKPGVIERDCYIAGADRVQFPHDIVFTGSKGYHPEYPQRPELIEWLSKTYGDRFGHYGNDGIRLVRGHDLNILYASSKVVVGDSCFGGRPNYVSDRYYEVRGRGGVLLHPQVSGVDNVGVTHYEVGNYDSLKKEIDSLLVEEEYREDTRYVGHNWAKDNETYTHRASEILKVIND